jgi:hypothetical protein
MKKKVSLAVVLSIHQPHRIVHSYSLSTTRTDILPPWRHHSRIRLKEGIAVAYSPEDCREEGVPPVVLLQPLIPRILPVSLLHTVVTLLSVPTAATGACTWYLRWAWGGPGGSIVGG